MTLNIINSWPYNVLMLCNSIGTYVCCQFVQFIHLGSSRDIILNMITITLVLVYFSIPQIFIKSWSCQLCDHMFAYVGFVF